VPGTKKRIVNKSCLPSRYVCGKNFRPLALSVPEIFNKNYKKARLTLTPSSGRTEKLSRVCSTSRESTIP